MNEEIKKIWIEALESGKYQQTTKSLKDHNGYCCLGVLCNLFDAEGWNEDANGAFDYFSDSATLPRQVVEWAGLLNANPSVGYVRATSLAELNDAGKTFKQIAQIIKKYL